MSSTPHTTFPKGSHVFVKLKNGETFLDQWESKKGRYVYFRNRSRILIKNIKSMGFKKLKPND